MQDKENKIKIYHYRKSPISQRKGAREKIKKKQKVARKIIKKITTLSSCLSVITLNINEIYSLFNIYK